MALGASWNANLDTPLSPEEADAAFDRAGMKEVRKAIMKDQAIADAVIQDAAAAAESGIIKELPLQQFPQAGQTITIGTGAESLTIQIERRAVEALAEARARAAIPAGRVVPGLGATTEGLIFQPVSGGRKAPTFVSVNIATGRTHRVIRKRGKYILQTLGGRAIDSGDNLALILLLFALLEKERRDREAKREQEAQTQ